MTRTVVRAALLAFGASILALSAFSSSADAAALGLFERDEEPVVVVASGPAVVEPGRTIDDLWIGKGQAIIRGRVEGSIVVLSGSAVIARGGFVAGDITVLAGTIDVRGDSVVRGDLQASGAILVHETASVDGTSAQKSLLDAMRTAPASFRSATWILLTVAVLALGLGLILGSRRAAERVATIARAWPMRSSLWGIAAVVMIPIAAALALLTIIGGLLGLLLIGALGIALVLGLVTTALVVGRMVASDDAHPVTTLLIGLAIIRLVAWLPGLFELVTIPAAIFGLGALLVTAREGWSADAAPTDATPDHPLDDVVPDSDDPKEQDMTADLSTWLDEPDRGLFDEDVDLRPPAPSIEAAAATPVFTGPAAEPPPPASPPLFTTPTPPPTSGTANGFAEPTVAAAADNGHRRAGDTLDDDGSWLTGLMEQAGRNGQSGVVDLRNGHANGHRDPAPSRPAAEAVSRVGPPPRRSLFGPEPDPQPTDEPVVVASVPVRPATFARDRRVSDGTTDVQAAGVRTWRPS